MFSDNTALSHLEWSAKNAQHLVENTTKKQFRAISSLLTANPLSVSPVKSCFYLPSHVLIYFPVSRRACFTQKCFLFRSVCLLRPISMNYLSSRDWSHLPADDLREVTFILRHDLETTQYRGETTPNQPKTSEENNEIINVHFSGSFEPLLPESGQRLELKLICDYVRRGECVFSRVFGCENECCSLAVGRAFRLMWCFFRFSWA